MTNKTVNDQIVEQMFTLSRLMKEEMTFDSETSALTILQLQTLIFIKRHEDVTMTDIANNFTITHPTATSLINKLVNAKLVKREHGKTDRRTVLLAITAKGQSLLTTAMKKRNERISTMLSYISPDEKEQLLTILKNIVTNMQK